MKLARAISGGGRDIPPEQIPAQVIARLAVEGVTSLEQWRSLARRRREIFGVTRRYITLLDELARQQP